MAGLWLALVACGIVVPLIVCVARPASPQDELQAAETDTDEEPFGNTD